MYTIRQQGDTVQTGVIEACVDTREDIATLPVNWKSGSVCLVIEDSSVWILGNDKQWHKL